MLETFRSVQRISGGGCPSMQPLGGGQATFMTSENLFGEPEHVNTMDRIMIKGDNSPVGHDDSYQDFD